MIDQQEAQDRAQALVKQFVTDAGCRDMQDVANVLALLASTAGMSMMEAIGQHGAVVRMTAATAYVADSGRHGVPPRAGMH